MEFNKLFSSKTATTLNTTEIAAYPKYEIGSDVSAGRREWLKDKKYAGVVHTGIPS